MCKSINLAVKRHINRFPERFMFQLNDSEYNNLRFQIETVNSISMSRNLPYAFTEQGVAMLATVLRSEKAVDISIKIMDAFVKMRHFIKDNSDIYKSLNRIDNKMMEHDEKIDFLFSKFDKKEHLFLEEHQYDAYRRVLEIFNFAKENIVVVDNYADRVFLDLIKNIKVKVTLITLNSKRLSDIEIEKYNKQYHNLEVIRDNSFHDRIMVIDNKEVYHLGSSINSLGDKVTAIIKLEDKKTLVHS